MVFSSWTHGSLQLCDQSHRPYFYCFRLAKNNHCYVRHFGQTRPWGRGSTIKEFLRLVKELIPGLCRCSFQSLSFFSDFNHHGWGGVPSQHNANGQLRKLISTSICWCSGVSGTLHFLPLRRDSSIPVMADNIPCLFCINKIPFLCAKAMKIWNLSIAHQIQISAIYCLVT